MCGGNSIHRDCNVVDDGSIQGLDALSNFANLGCCGIRLLQLLEFLRKVAHRYDDCRFRVEHGKRGFGKLLPCSPQIGVGRSRLLREG